MEIPSSKPRKKDISGYRIGRDLGMDNNLTYKYIQRWEENGLIICDEDSDKKFYTLNPKMFRNSEKSVSFDIDGLQITVSAKDQKT